MKPKSILYLGLEVPEKYQSDQVLHYPIIKTIPRRADETNIQTICTEFSRFTHAVFTSKNAVRIFLHLAFANGVLMTHIQEKFVIAVGKSTAQVLLNSGKSANLIAAQETSEGIAAEIDRLDMKKAHVLWPHSSLSRPVLADYFKQKGISFCACPLYDTVPHFPHPLPNLTEMEEIIFTSPSTVDAFLKGYGKIPQDKTLSCIGPITEKYLKECIDKTDLS